MQHNALKVVAWKFTAKHAKFFWILFSFLVVWRFKKRKTPEQKYSGVLFNWKLPYGTWSRYSLEEHSAGYGVGVTDAVAAAGVMDGQLISVGPT